MIFSLEIYVGYNAENKHHYIKTNTRMIFSLEIFVGYNAENKHHYINEQNVNNNSYSRILFMRFELKVFSSVKLKQT